MKGNQRRPLWSQPLCEHCYFVRFGMPCKGRSAWIKKEHCFDCGAITEDGIYTDVRPAEDRDNVVRGGSTSLFEQAVEEWVKQNGEYRGGVAPGSAEGE